MPRPTAEQIRTRIREALVREVAEKGIGAVSVSHVAKRARISPGTIYLHFDSKEDMLQKVYLEIKTEFHGIIVAARDEPCSRAMIRRMWRDLFDFVSAHPHDFQFVEYAGAAQVLTAAQSRSIGYMQAEIAAMLQRAVDDGTLAPLPIATLTVLLVAPAMHLARTALLAGRAVQKSEIDLTFERVWIGVSAR